MEENSMENVIIVRYAEIYLKGLNRPYFEKALVRNMEKALSGIEGFSIRRSESLVYIEGIKESGIPRALEALKFVFGIHSFSSAVRIGQSIEEAGEVLSGMVAEEMKRFPEGAAFRVEAKRADKSFPVKSNEIAAKAGGIILESVKGLRVDLIKPDITAYLEMRESAYCYTKVIGGPGGMPVGCGGRAMLLLSGGIDSPVAGLMTSKRGVALSAVHFESFPYTSEKALGKVVDLARIMTGYAGPIKLHIIRFTEIQTKLHEDCPSDYLTVLMRRFMMRIAERLAEKDKCLALVTGESIGQVASQTLESIAATNAVVSLPVIRPLIGMDKSEIIEKAESYGTFRTSILPYEDCCTVFVPRHPVTKPNITGIEKAEERLDINAMVDAALSGDRVMIVE
jgi:tRNA uracil 4-sulfurtransferase